MLPGGAIAEVTAWEALDSRGDPTVACEVTLADGTRGEALAPAGASTGTYEAMERRDGGDRYGGRGVRSAVRNVVDVLGPAVTGLSAADQEAVDAALTAADGTTDLSRLGANAVLSLSLAAMVAAARHQGLPLYRAVATGEALLPLPMVNIVSGGAHAGGLIDIQDVLVVPLGAGSFAEAIEMAWSVRAAAQARLARTATTATLVADEGGLAAALASNEAALALVSDAIVDAGYVPGTDAGIAVDVAANGLWAGDGYRLASEGRGLGPEEWTGVVAGWVRDYPVVSVEDPAADDDWKTWEVLSRALATTVQLLGDDLFATSEERLRRGVDAGVANAVLIKPNQNGTVSGARRVVAAARAAGYATVLSARSGETEESWLADLAVGWRTGQIKVGSTTRSERTAKWNRLLRIEADLGRSARFAGAAALAARRP